MPELPEVETIRRGVSLYLIGQTIQKVIVRNPRLRWPIPPTLNELLHGQTIRNISRRAKYLLFHFDTGTLLIHLGMSGNLCIVATDAPAEKHDHVDLVLAEYHIRYRDPRRFGAILWHSGPIELHPLLSHLGLEPLQDCFSGLTLYQASQRYKISAKQLIMNHHVVVGIGNIYANEALFQAAIHPKRPSSHLARDDCDTLASAIRNILEQAIEAGGSSLRNFVDARGKAGYFQHSYRVYGRVNLPCYACGTLVEKIRQQQRSSYFCPNCQAR